MNPSRFRSSVPKFASLLLCLLAISHFLSVLNASAPRALNTIAVCTSAGLVQMPFDDGSSGPGTPQHRAGLDCPLCSSGAAPPESIATVARIDWPLFSLPVGNPVLRDTALGVGPPLPARGPPVV
jgi:hypothetical protein